MLFKLYLFMFLTFLSINLSAQFGGTGLFASFGGKPFIIGDLVQCREKVGYFFKDVYSNAFHMKQIYYYDEKEESLIPHKRDVLAYYINGRCKKFERFNYLLKKGLNSILGQTETSPDLLFTLPEYHHNIKQAEGNGPKKYYIDTNNDDQNHEVLIR